MSNGDFTDLMGDVDVEILPAGDTDLTGDGVGARTCLTGEGDCRIGDGDCCRAANCALAGTDGGVGDLDFGLGGILGGVLCGSCCPVAPSMTISTVAIDLASKWASIFFSIRVCLVSEI